MIFSGFSALRAMSKIKNGKTAKLSVAQIATLNINLIDARKNLSKEEYNNIYELYEKFLKCRTKIKMNQERYLYIAIKIIKKFDSLAPYEKYCGGNEFEYSTFLMNEIHSLPDDFSVDDYDIEKLLLFDIDSNFTKRETKRVYCKKCGSLIDNNTKKCSGCGKQYFSLKNIYNKMNSLFYIIVIFLLFLTNIYFWNIANSYKNELTSYENINSENQEKIEMLEQKNKQLNRNYEKLENDYHDAYLNSIRYSDLISQLDKSSKNENFASVSSRIYAVPKGGTEYINVNFKKDSLYISWNSENICAEWYSDRIKITGLSQGISNLYISDDEQGLNEMSIVVICY